MLFSASVWASCLWSMAVGDAPHCFMAGIYPHCPEPTDRQERNVKYSHMKLRKVFQVLDNRPKDVLCPEHM